ncbi:MAG: hypothetical protein ACLTFB_00910 [Candidatus Phytoplasma pyri]
MSKLFKILINIGICLLIIILYNIYRPNSKFDIPFSFYGYCY